MIGTQHRLQLLALSDIVFTVVIVDLAWILASLHACIALLGVKSHVWFAVWNLSQPA